MPEFIFGFGTGGVTVCVIMFIYWHNTRQDKVEAQEKDLALLQQHVDKAGEVIERIVYRSKS
jgi:hypothetical protein